MRIRNEKLLKSLRVAGRCEWCGKWCQVREVLHLHAKGMGAGHQLDVAINLLSVCLGPWSGNWSGCDVHGESHVKPQDFDLLAVVAAREGELQPDIEEALWVLDRLPRDCRPWQLDANLRGCNEAVKRLVFKSLNEKGKP